MCGKQRSRSNLYLCRCTAFFQVKRCNLIRKNKINRASLLLWMSGCKTMNLKYIRSLVFVLIGAGVGFAFWVLLPSLFYIETNRKAPESKIHAFHNPDFNFEKIRIRAFYVVPKNKTADAVSNWKEVMETALKKASEFHQVQFREKSILVYDIYPEPVILKENNIYYDTESTKYGNPKALINIANELEKRVFKKEGDLYIENFSQRNASEYPVLGIIYEGVGAAGGVIYESELESTGDIARKLGLSESVIYKVDVESADGFFILSRSYLTDPEYRLNGATHFYHEFAHTFGLPDGYDLKTGVSSTFDIMGEGRKKPIDIMYLDRKFTRAMGLAE